MSNDLGDLRNAIKQGHALAIIGAGVSMQATGNDPVASWIGLLKHGVDYCKSYHLLIEKTAEIAHSEIAQKDLLHLLSGRRENLRTFGISQRRPISGVA